MHGSAFANRKLARSLLASRCASCQSRLVAGVQAAPAEAPFRAFQADSLWNIPAAQKGQITSSNPMRTSSRSYDSTMNISGIPPDIRYAKPTYEASPADPCRTVTIRHPDWAFGNVEYHGECVPVPPALPRRRAPTATW